MTIDKLVEDVIALNKRYAQYAFLVSVLNTALLVVVILFK
jgi:hypothetical protein